MLSSLDQLESTALAELALAADAAALAAWHKHYLSDKGKVKAAQATLKDIPKDQRAPFGQRVNALSKSLQAAHDERQGSLGLSSTAGDNAARTNPSGPTIDVTEPGVLFADTVARQHVISRVKAELAEVFARMGFSVATGPELEDDEHNFAKLNIPPNHPAREPIDNFYIDDPARTNKPRMLRSQTSTVQIRVMESQVARAAAAAKATSVPVVGGLDQPIRIIAPGRVYRPDTVDATHSFMFHQIEGLCIDRAVSMVDLKATLLQFARAYFGPDAQLRLRPTFFPFTEPSAELDLRIRLRPDAPLKWMELGGCGMVHPNVLRASGIDPDIWTGFAFGFGIERLAMGKYAIPDIRMLFENDLRFLKQL